VGECLAIKKPHTPHTHGWLVYYLQLLCPLSQLQPYANVAGYLYIGQLAQAPSGQQALVSWWLESWTDHSDHWLLRCCRGKHADE